VSAGPTGTSSPPAAAGCPSRALTVTTASELKSALASPEPGTVIRIADGVYIGNFVATGKATADRPITLCGSVRAVLDGGGTEDGYVLHLNRASHWIVQGFTVRNGQKGIMADETTHSLFQGLTVSGTGDEAIHLRKFSSDNQVTGNTIRGAGLRQPKFGEGIYVGTAESNWCDISNCEPDKSDRNRLTDNVISGTTAECIDIKEGTSDGVLLNNTFDGSSLANADSWVDVKGRGWTIEGNTGRNSPRDGFQTHEIVDGWGTGNVFRNNTAEVNGPGLGYSLKPVRGNIVECNNSATHAGKGLSNEPCSSG
jgi:parallel beta-helix repeat protein